jgi:formylmethanofuran dehydrogenase subunit E
MREKAKKYVIQCSKCKALTDLEEILWLNRVPICVHCIAKKVVSAKIKLP